MQISAGPLLLCAEMCAEESLTNRVNYRPAAPAAMPPLLTVHALSSLIGVAAIGNALLAVWAFGANLFRARTLSRAYWVAILLVAVLVAIQVASGLLLAVGGARPKTALHFLYGFLVAVTATVQVGLRPGGFLRPVVTRAAGQFREARWLALICLTQMALILRAYTTGALGR